MTNDAKRHIYAHSLANKTEKYWQPLTRHLENVARLAGRFAESFHAGRWAEALGLLHDLGKATEKYQKRLQGAPLMVDHSTAGAQQAATALGAAGRILAACIAGHHAGLMDGKSNKDSCLMKRLTKAVPDLLPFFAIPDKLTHLGKFPFKPDPATLPFQISFFTRMLFSCLVDADFLDTERFMDPQRARWREGFPTLDEIYRRLEKNFAKFISSVPETEINHKRKFILNECRTRALDPPGLFSLTVPTGGGKTLASFAFALKHAISYGLERIIYVIPYTSIIEQNAEVFRRFVGEDAVLEHHSTYDASLSRNGGSESDETLHRIELAAENWDAPLVVTTAVQFFESLFANRPSRCRKLHNIARSVVILDEAQMLPVPFLLPCLEAIRELTRNYGTSVVLCTATQPALSRNDKFDRGLENVREIMPEPRSLYRSFSRITVEDAGVLSLEQLADYVEQHSQVLCVVTTRREARELFKMIRHHEGAFHLSALLCPQHRWAKLTEVQKRLKEGIACRLVSTRLIEAGVDVDFPIVFRAIAGIDSIAQAGGRCNREGKLPSPGQLIIYRPKEGLPPGNFRPPAECAAEITRRHGDPLSLEAIEDYFRLLYWRVDEGLDAKKILERLEEGLAELLFPFETVAEKFRLIEDISETVLVPWDERARDLIRRLGFAEFPGSILRRLQRYGVPVWPNVLQELVAAGVVEYVQGLFPVITSYGFEQHYDDDLGLIFDHSAPVDPESLVF